METLLYVSIWGLSIVGAIVFLKYGVTNRSKKLIAVGTALALLAVLFGYYYSPLKEADIPSLFQAYLVALSLLIALTVYTSYKNQYTGEYEIPFLEDKSVVISIGLAGSIIYIALFGLESYVSYTFTYIFALMFIVPVIQMLKNKEIDVRKVFSIVAASILLPALAMIASKFSVEIDIIKSMLSGIVLLMQLET